MPRWDFTEEEVRDIALSVLVLGFVFSYRWLPLVWENPILIIRVLFESCLLVGIAFVLHELAHRFVARRYDCKAQYVIWPQGLVLSLFTAFISQGQWVFAAPGFVLISTAYATRLGYRFVSLTVEERGKIALAGPITNILLAIGFKFLRPISPMLSIAEVPLFIYCARINLFLATFNLIPFGLLDGTKVFRWSRIIWGFGMASSIFLLITIEWLPAIALLLALGAIAIVLFLLGQKLAPRITIVKYIR
jgi:Zn-dependent protease